MTHSGGSTDRVRVVIASADERDVRSTVGLGGNIIEARWLALVDAVEYTLCKDESGVATGRP